MHHRCRISKGLPCLCECEELERCWLIFPAQQSLLGRLDGGQLTHQEVLDDDLLLRSFEALYRQASDDLSDDTCFLLQLSQNGSFGRFAWLNVPFGQDSMDTI